MFGLSMEGVWNCKELQGKWSMMPEFGKQSFMSCNQGSGCMEKICFHMREINAIFGSCVVLEGLILLGFWARSQQGLVLLGFGCMGFAMDALETLLAYVSGNATEEAKVVIELTLMFLGHQFTVFAKLQWKNQEWVPFGSEVLPWVEPELFFHLDKELLLDLFVWLGWLLDLGSDLFPEDLEVWVSWELLHVIPSIAHQ